MTERESGFIPLEFNRLGECTDDRGRWALSIAGELIGMKCDDESISDLLRLLYYSNS